MAWGINRIKQGNDDNVNFELNDETKKQLEDGKKAAEELVKVREELEELKLSASETEALKLKIAELETKLTPKKELVTEDKQITTEDYLTDPLSVTRRIVEETTKPIANAVLVSGAQNVIREAKNRFGSDWTFFEKEINEILTKQSNLNQLNNPSYVENVFHTVRSRNIDKLNTPEYSTFIETSRRNGANFTPEETKKKRKFTEEEKSFFSRYNIKEDEAEEAISSGRFGL